MSYIYKQLQIRKNHTVVQERTFFVENLVEKLLYYKTINQLEKYFL